MRKLLPLLLLGGALAACQDEMPLTPLARPDGPAARGIVTTQPADWRGYWRNDHNLWVYDVTPEVGIHSARGVPVDFDAIRDAGMRIVRYPVNWRDYEAARLAGCVPYGSAVGCATEGLANAVGWAAERDIQLLVEVYSWPTRTDSMTTAQRYEQFAQLMDDIVVRYPDVKFWQLGNEQDAGYTSEPFYNTGSLSSCTSSDRSAYGVQYAKMLKVVYPRIKAANPSAWVLTAGLTGNEGYTTLSGVPSGPGSGAYCGNQWPSAAVTWTFLNGMYTEDHGESFDILAFHSYGTTPATLQAKGQSLISAVNQNGDGNRPIWVTEFGANSNDVSEGGNLLDPAQKSGWRAMFEQKQEDWWSGALQTQAIERLFPKMIGFTLIGDDTGGCIDNTNNAKDFLAPTDADCYEYGHNILTAAGVPRQTYNWLVARKTTNEAAETIGERTGPFTIWMNSDFWRVPADHAFEYSNGSYIVKNVTVTTLYPASVKFMKPFTAQASSWNSITPGPSTWLAPVANGAILGTVGQNRPLEAVAIARVDLPTGIDMHYGLDVQTLGWIDAINGNTAGTVGQGRTTYHFRMSLTDPQNRGWSVCYQAYVASNGWTGESCDGVPAGTGASHLEAVRIYLKKP